MPDGGKKRQLRFLIIKTSSLGDIIQAFHVLNYLQQKFPSAKIDWIVERASFPLVATHPLIDDAILFDFRLWRKKLFSKKTISHLRSFFKRLRSHKYNAVFDLQGNCKSALVTFFSRSGKKVGFDIHTVREWPNVLATHTRFHIPKSGNIRFQYLKLVQSYFSDQSSIIPQGVRLKIKQEEKKILDRILIEAQVCGERKMMVCPHSKWSNKQLDFDTLAEFLKLVQRKYSMGFLFIWGSEEEKRLSEQLDQKLSQSILVERLSLPLLQNLMNEVDLIFAVDSSPLHLCGTTSCRSFSLFGPTSVDVFKPMGEKHFGLQGYCPYGKVFEKQCPRLRTCPTGACIRNLEAERIFKAFSSWWAHPQSSPHKETILSKSI